MAVTEETTPLGTAWAAFASCGVQSYKLTQNGFYDDAAGASNAALLAAVGTNMVGAINLQKNTVGKKFIGLSGQLETNYKRLSKRKELHKANADYVITGVVEEATILYPLSAANSAGPVQGTTVDNAASSANGGSGYLEVIALALGNRTNLLCKVQHSVDNITYIDLVTFTAVTTAPNGQRVTVAGTVNRYLQSQYAWTGGSSGQSATVMIGFYRN